MDNATKDMKDVTVEEFEEGRLARIISAQSGKWTDGSWWLEDGAVYEINKETKEVGLLFKFDRQALTLNLGPNEISAKSASPDEMTIPELVTAVKLKEKMGEGTGDLWMALQLRIAVPWACLIFAMRCV